MGLAHSPSIVRDGLVLHLDAANTKCYPPDNLEVEYLIVAGGGGGGCGDDGSALGGGGGGAGGFLYGKKSVSTGSNSIVVGAGGAGKDGPNTINSANSNNAYPEQTGANGSDSTAFGLTAVGGGGGGTRNAHENGKSGGSGGGACGVGNDGSPASGGTATSGQGNAGGSNTAEWGSCGGGGAGSAGQSLSGSNARIVGSGGDGLSSFITGTRTYYAGGGGGGGHRADIAEGTGGTGGIGGGASGGNFGTTQGQNATANTGGGGGGGPAYSTNPQVNSDGGSGGSGVVIIRYKGPQKATGGDSVYQSGPYTVHVFNNSGNFVVGNTTGDISGNQNTGALNNGATFNSANGGSFAFDGVDDLVSGNLGNLNAPFTLECIGKFDNLTKNDYEYFCSVGDSGTNSMISISKVGTQNATTSRHGFMYLYPGSVSIRFTDIDLRSTDYQHITVVCITTAPYVLIYKNAVPGSIETAITGPINTNGNYRLGTWSNSTWWLDGNIASFKVYNRALTAAEVAQNFEATSGRYGI